MILIDFNVCVPATLLTRPMTALSLISSTVVAGSLRSDVARKLGGSTVASTLSPTESRDSGTHRRLDNFVKAEGIRPQLLVAECVEPEDELLRHPAQAGGLALDVARTPRKVNVSEKEEASG